MHIINSEHDIGGAESLVRYYSRLQNGSIVWSLFSDKSKKNKVIFYNFFKFFKDIKSVNIIHVHLFPSLYLAAILSIFFKKKFIYTEHNTWNRRRNFFLLRSLEKIVYSRFLAVICISHATKESLELWIGEYKNSKFIVIQNGIDINYRYYQYNEIANNTKSTLKSILMVGRFTPQKNQKLLIEILQYEKNINLFLVGDGELLDDMRTLSKLLKVSERVFFLGNSNHPIILPCKPDLYIQSSHWEGFGLTVVEAIASGIPCIVSDVDGLKDVIPHAKKFSNNIKSLRLTLNMALNNDNDNYQIINQLEDIERYNIIDHISKINKLYDDENNR